MAASSLQSLKKQHQAGLRAALWRAALAYQRASAHQRQIWRQLSAAAEAARPAISMVAMHMKLNEKRRSRNEAKEAESVIIARKRGWRRRRHAAGVAARRRITRNRNGEIRAMDGSDIALLHLLQSMAASALASYEKRVISAGYLWRRRRQSVVARKEKAAKAKAAKSGQRGRRKQHGGHRNVAISHGGGGA